MAIINLSVFECENMKICEDSPVPTAAVVQERQPDLVQFLKDRNEIWIMDVMVRWDPLISERERENTAKYQDLAIDMGRRYQGWKVQVWPIVMGALRTVGRLSQDLQAIGCFETYEVRLTV